MTVELFTCFWWLIFPIMWMVFGIVRLVLRGLYDQRKLDLMKSYLAQGKDIPDALRREINR
ncbi:hypothetical protein AEAC466_09230 [Asticcacaulis sp. AC466]|uniref:hypothetical protein n=1 Tax=Asticcacaulis sp. AC466 TaxID=1282362 RepID=UPI0003C3C916|nr:hypothetical protein [Asticcacaulis sp. AC466]ESQ84524.1 hypothetical protein AEAC466_09230 [Asticcacaulis sp. AC466]